MVVTTPIPPAGVTIRIELFELVRHKDAATRIHATPDGPKNCALVFVPSRFPCVPPAIVVTIQLVPAGVIFRMALLLSFGHEDIAGPIRRDPVGLENGRRRWRR